MQKVEEKENVLNWQDHGALVATQRNLIQNYVFTVVDDSLVDKVICAIIDAAGTGSAGDGKIFVTTIDDAIDIGSKQKGVHVI
jgi:nitrogen regulatory protein PII